MNAALNLRVLYAMELVSDQHLRTRINAIFSSYPSYWPMHWPKLLHTEGRTNTASHSLYPKQFVLNRLTLTCVLPLTWETTLHSRKVQ